MIQERYELLRTNDGWVAQTHCDCGITLMSGDPGGPLESLASAIHLLTIHLAKCGHKCGTKSHAAVECYCPSCKQHNTDLASMVDQPQKYR